jgi:hypothetical protein
MVFRLALVLSHACVWIAAQMVVAQTSAGPQPVMADDSAVSMMVFVAALIATASFTWAVAKLDNNRVNRLENLEKVVAGLATTTDHINKQLNALAAKMNCDCDEDED